MTAVKGKQLLCMLLLLLPLLAILTCFAYRYLTRCVLCECELSRFNGLVAAMADGTVAVVEDIC